MSRSAEDGEVYASWLKAEVDRLQAGGARALDDLVPQLPGVYPAELRRHLEGSEQGRIPHPLVAAPALTGPRAYGAPPDGAVIPRLPPPHPLDYEWRFSRRAAEVLIAVVKTLDIDDAALVLVGASTVAGCPELWQWRGRLTALDRNAVVLRAVRARSPAFRAIECDVTREALPNLEADLVITDPPWYPEHVMSFLWACCHVARRGGRLLVSLPPVGTRPGILRERQALFGYALALGLEPLGLDAQTLPYETPFFEFNALRAAGITAVAPCWRKGDLATFRKVRESDVARPPPVVEPGRWAEVSTPYMRVKFREAQSSPAVHPHLEEVVPGAILPSVSRRDPRRDQIAVWTSGNRVFKCARPDLSAEVLRASLGGELVEERVVDRVGRSLTSEERASVCQAGRQWAQVIDLERNEFEAYVKVEQAGAVAL